MFKLFIGLVTVLFANASLAGDIQCEVISTRVRNEELAEVGQVQSVAFKDHVIEIKVYLDSNPLGETIWSYEVFPYSFNGTLILRGRNMSVYPSQQPGVFEVQFQDPDADLVNEWPLYISTISCTNM